MGESILPKGNTIASIPFVLQVLTIASIHAVWGARHHVKQSSLLWLLEKTLFMLTFFVHTVRFFQVKECKFWH